MKAGGQGKTVASATFCPGFATDQQNYRQPDAVAACPAKQTPGHTHLNAVAVRKGQMCVLLNRFGLVYNTITDSILIEDPSIIGCHNLVFLGDKILINDSKGKGWWSTRKMEIH